MKRYDVKMSDECVIQLRPFDRPTAADLFPLRIREDREPRPEDIRRHAFFSGLFFGMLTVLIWVGIMSLLISRFPTVW